MSIPAVVFTVRLTARTAEIRREIAALLGPVAAQPGCQRCTAMQDAHDASVLLVIGEWATRSDLDRHFRSEECRRLLALAEHSAEPPEFAIDTLVRREGLEAIARSRAVDRRLSTSPSSRS